MVSWGWRAAVSDAVTVWVVGRLLVRPATVAAPSCRIFTHVHRRLLPRSLKVNLSSHTF